MLHNSDKTVSLFCKTFFFPLRVLSEDFLCVKDRCLESQNLTVATTRELIASWQPRNSTLGGLDTQRRRKKIKILFVTFWNDNQTSTSQRTNNIAKQDFRV